VLDSSDPGFEQTAFAGLWNKLQPKRHPQIIAQARDEQDVVAAVKFARAKKLKVTVRGGGHSWCNPSLRDNGLLIDLTNLNRVLSIDTDARRAVVQPVVSNRQVQNSAKFSRNVVPDRPLPGGQAQRLLAEWRHVLEPWRLGSGRRKC
jgi:FAD/FMN-containing dehydrogenase